MADTLVQRIIDRLEAIVKEEDRNIHDATEDWDVGAIYASAAIQSCVDILREESAKFEQEQKNA